MNLGMTGIQHFTGPLKAAFIRQYGRISISHLLLYPKSKVNVSCPLIFHDLRHTSHTDIRKAGIPEALIIGITGHETREMFDRYNRVDEEDTRQAVDQNVDQHEALNL